MSQISVRLKKDPSKVRLMTERSLQANSNKWERVPDGAKDPSDKSDIAIALAKAKKKPAGLAGGVTADSDIRIGGPKVEPVESTDFVKVITETPDFEKHIGESFEGTIKFSEENEGPSSEQITEFLEIRKAYQLKAGKPADKRWSPMRIKSELEKLNTK